MLHKCIKNTISILYEGNRVEMDPLIQKFKTGVKKLFQW